MNNVNHRAPFSAPTTPITCKRMSAQVDAVKGLTDEGICRQEVITCMGVPFRVFGGTPLGIYAVGPGRRVGMVGRNLAGMGYLVVFYRYGSVRYGTVRYGTVRYGTVLCGVACSSPLVAGVLMYGSFCRRAAGKMA